VVIWTFQTMWLYFNFTSNIAIIILNDYTIIVCHQFQYRPTLLWSYGLHSGNSRKIDLHSKHWQNKLQVLTKTNVTYKWNVTYSLTCTIVFAMNRGIYYWVNFSLYHPLSPCIEQNL